MINRKTGTYGKEENIYQSKSSEGIKTQHIETSGTKYYKKELSENNKLI